MKKELKSNVCLFPFWLIISIIFCSTPICVLGQNNAEIPFSIEVKQIYPPFAISKAELSSAQNLLDLNKNFKSSWIRRYISTEISTFYKEEKISAMGTNEVLTVKQKEVLNMADSGAKIKVSIIYMPENNLSHNEKKEIDFTLNVTPDKNAQYINGHFDLHNYLNQRLLPHITDSVFGEYQLSVVKFTIGENGELINPHIFWSSENEQMDALLIETICQMGNWKPAKHQDGTKIAQEFALVVGDPRSCAMNTLNFKK